MSDLKQLINKAINNYEQANPKPLPKRKSDDQLSAEKTRPTKQATLDLTPIMFNNDQDQPRPKAIRVPITQLSNVDCVASFSTGSAILKKDTNLPLSNQTPLMTPY